LNLRTNPSQEGGNDGNHPPLKSLAKRIKEDEVS